MVTVKKMNLLSMALVACMSVVPAVQAQDVQMPQEVASAVIEGAFSPQVIANAVVEALKAEKALEAAKPFKTRLWEFVKANPKESVLAVLATGTAVVCSYYFGKLVGGWGKKTVAEGQVRDTIVVDGNQMYRKMQ